MMKMLEVMMMMGVEKVEGEVDSRLTAVENAVAGREDLFLASGTELQEAGGHMRLLFAGTFLCARRRAGVGSFRGWRRDRRLSTMMVHRCCCCCCCFCNRCRFDH